MSGIMQPMSVCASTPILGPSSSGSSGHLVLDLLLDLDLLDLLPLVRHLLPMENAMCIVLLCSVTKPPLKGLPEVKTFCQVPNISEFTRPLSLQDNLPGPQCAHLTEVPLYVFIQRKVFVYIPPDTV